MKKITLIASAFALILATSCQKDEFENVFEEASTSKVSNKVFDVERTENSGINGSGIADDSVDSKNESSNDEVKVEDIIIINIKEVSDGDDEADNGDESRKTK